MTIQEIKQWLDACKHGELMTQSDAYEAIGTLLEQVEAVGICELCQADAVARADQYRDKLTCAKEALNFIASPDRYDLFIVQQYAGSVLKNLNRRAVAPLRDTA